MGLKKKKKKQKQFLKYVGIFIMVIVISILAWFIYYKMTFVDNLVNKKRNEWDLPLIQSTILSGNFMGTLYEKEYDVSSLPSDVVSAMIADYFIYNDDDFFQDKNMDENYFYRKTVSLDIITETYKKMFGPDLQLPNLTDVSYGCGRYFIRQGNNYLISSYDEESCGLFQEDTDSYLTKITDYQKKDDNIYINMKVGYLDREINETTGNVSAKIYDTEDKGELLNPNYDIECYYSDSPGAACYNSFKDYVITLSKASDNKYYFNSIRKK